MDNLTHSLFALTLARTRLGRAGRGATAALVLASNAPDIDAVSWLAGGMGSYLRWHRGPAHGLLGIAALGCACGAVVRGACRLWKRPHDATPDAPLESLIAISSLAVLCHILMDLPTSYGTRLLSPFDWHWFAVDWMPIVDIYLLVALGVPLLAGRASSDARRRNAALAIVLMATIYSIRGVAHHRALDVAPRLFGDTLPPPCGPAASLDGSLESWPHAVAAPAPGGHRCLVEMTALPTFASPFEWRVIARTSNAYDVHDVNVLDARFLQPAPPSEVLWRTTLHVPAIWTPPALVAAGTESARSFLGFSRFPIPRTQVDSAGVTMVRWTDARFTGGSTTLAVEVRLATDGRVLQQGFAR
jgi:membrane-bound metal-dependent hydrolase YbcI (DUF457 family)